MIEIDKQIERSREKREKEIEFWRSVSKWCAGKVNIQPIYKYEIYFCYINTNSHYKNCYFSV